MSLHRAHSNKTLKSLLYADGTSEQKTYTYEQYTKFNNLDQKFTVYDIKDNHTDMHDLMKTMEEKQPQINDMERRMGILESIEPSIKDMMTKLN